MFTKLRQRIYAHKVISAIVAIIVVGGGYYWYSSSQGTATVTKYFIENATQGTVVSSVTGSGQVQAVTSVDIKPQVSENVTKVYVKVGDHVKAGQLLVQLDTTNEEKALQQAQLSLQSSQLSLSKLQVVATTTLLSDQDAVTRAQASLVDASTTLAKDYRNSFATLSSAFVDLQNVMAGVQSFVTGTDINKNQGNPDAYVNLLPDYLQGGARPYRDAVMADFAVAITSYQQNAADYHVVSSTADAATLDSLFSETYHTAQLVSETVNASENLLNYVVNNYPQSLGLAKLPTITTTFQTDMGNYTNDANGDLTNLSGILTNISNDKTSFSDAELSLNEASTTLAQLVAGPSTLDVQSQQLSIQGSQISLGSAQQNLAECSILAPIDGIVSAVPSVVGVTVPSPAVSMVTQGQLAQVTLNEVDAAKVNLGDKATLTFDALPDLTLAGTVTEIDAVGTVSQGVVSYNVQIGFEEASGTSQVKPGMSVAADIVTEIHQNVIAVPNAAVSTVGSSSYVMEPSSRLPTSTISESATNGVELTVAPVRVPVTVGLSNDSLTEITSGVNVGDQIVTKTITSAASSASSASTRSVTGGATGGTSVFRLGGIVGGGGTAPGR